MGIILNKEKIATSELRGQALEILEAGLQAINTEKILRKKLHVENGKLFIKNNKELINVGLPSPYKLEGGRRPGGVYFIGIGKCALEGAKVIEEILGDKLTGGIALDVKDSSESKLSKIIYKQGTHPYPSLQNVEATKEILKMVENLTPNDLVICLISGGGSSLFELPAPGVTLEDIVQKTKELTAEGADIYGLNNFRKSVSQVKGGKFAQKCFPAKVVSLIFSDVLGNDISVIASGPTFLSGVKNILIVSNRDALEAMKIKAEELGFDAEIETEKLSGNASEVGKEIAERSPKPKTCILFGGETTVRIPQTHGVGGRNQEMALSALLYIKENSVLICASSDGFDNTDHAGAIVDRELFKKTKVSGILPEQFLMHGDSYNFFKKMADGAIYTARLGSNVSDLCIMIYK